MIDWTRVNELKEEIGPDDFTEVVEVFLAEMDDVMSRLKTAPDPAQYEADLHFVKSSALNIGFDELSKLCQIGERQAATGAAANVDLAPIFASYDASKHAFAAG